MKAWKVWDGKSNEDWTTVVFAETRSKAHKLAMSTDTCEYAEWIDVRLRRVPVLDDEYRGRWEMDWNIVEDRIALVKKANFICSYEIDDWDCHCELCPATAWCDRYERMHEDDER